VILKVDSLQKQDVGVCCRMNIKIITFWDGEGRAEIPATITTTQGVFWVLLLKNKKKLRVNSRHIIHYRDATQREAHEYKKAQSQLIE